MTKSSDSAAAASLATTPSFLIVSVYSSTSIEEERSSAQQSLTMCASLFGLRVCHMILVCRNGIFVAFCTQKTFDIMNTSDPAIVSWVDGGHAFVIKDVDTFSNTIIPDYFKHRKFSSFVRQLNFYGFRKIKTGKVVRVTGHGNAPTTTLSTTSSSTTTTPSTQYVESKYWKFRHEKFKQGRPDLLAYIKKSQGGGGDPGASCDVDKPNEEVMDELRQEIRVLEDSTHSMRREISDLRGLVESLVRLQQPPQQPTAAAAAAAAASTSATAVAGTAATAPVSAFGSLSVGVSDLGTAAMAAATNGQWLLPLAPPQQSLSAHGTFSSTDSGELRIAALPMSVPPQPPVWSGSSSKAATSAFQPFHDAQGNDQPLYQQGLVSMDYTSTPPFEALDHDDDDNDDDDDGNPVALQAPATPLATHYALTRSTSQSLFEQSILASLMSLEGGGREDAMAAADTGGTTSPFLDFVI
jgi:HSF-type DNA-binding